MKNKYENGDKNKSYQLISLFLLAVIHGHTHCFLIGAIVYFQDPSVKHFRVKLAS